ncbi:uncharacterized protein C8Q71DRAFT_362966 [Rhodofomes roseus]|uniref:Uncharacterized protein n=1 Tax=Rhodofomes roseus TaxID=34475 RepID=A0ABQ8K182_9APHY|nr:uncharacterized protein C8Q71DRAFT_362966 [Rhodofomes roseus]KAH9830405.1 hypothetical protein C8Q71DRAFT_362966 [Rhodofomes roseus]
MPASLAVFTHLAPVTFCVVRPQTSSDSPIGDRHAYKERHIPVRRPITSTQHGPTSDSIQLVNFQLPRRQLILELARHHPGHAAVGQPPLGRLRERTGIWLGSGLCDGRLGDGVLGRGRGSFGRERLPGPAAIHYGRDRPRARIHPRLLCESTCMDSVNIQYATYTDEIELIYCSAGKCQSRRGSGDSEEHQEYGGTPHDELES